MLYVVACEDANAIKIGSSGVVHQTPSVKSLDDRYIDIPELGPCSECSNEILTLLKLYFLADMCSIDSALRFEKKLLLTIPNA
jgi:hypothetical protein